MTVKIEVQQAREVTSDGKYWVHTSVVYARDISSAIFVVDTGTNEFSHVAFVYDLLSYPVGKTYAVNAGAPYYREASISVAYDDVETAINAAAYTLHRIDWLTTQFTDSLTTFVGEGAYTYEGEE